MTPKETIARIDKAHTKENETRLKAEFAQRGMKLRRAGTGKSGFSFTDPQGSTIAGITLADAEGLLEKITKG